MKKKLLITSAVVLSGVGSLAAVGIASAASNTSNASNSNDSSIVDKIATRFGLNKADVQQVFDQNRADHQAERKANIKAKLDQAVKDGKLTQAQEDHILQVQGEIEALIGTTKPSQLSQSTKDQIKAKVDELKQWAIDNKIDLRYIGGPGLHAGKGHGMGMKDDDGPGTQQAND